MNGENSIRETSNMWKTCGLFFEPDRGLEWSRSHAMLPTPIFIDGTWRVYYSGRNILNQSSIGYFEIDSLENPKVVFNSPIPVLKPGELGCFDDNGVSPSCLIELGDGRLAMYYIGWNPGSTTRVNLFGGLAISHDRGRSFQRWSRAPILERTHTDPFMNTAPWVIKLTNGYVMYYVSGMKWESRDHPRYNIKIAHSKDGLNWVRKGKVVLDFCSNSETALARPYVVHQDNVWRMWVSSRVGNYSIAYAESKDGINWERNDSRYGLSPNGSGEEKSMTEYAAVIAHDDRWMMFYNGENYGQNGILMAVSDK